MTEKSISKAAAHAEMEDRVFWVFGYGSLMWDSWEQRFSSGTKTKAVVAGVRRVFNKASVENWGTKQAPGPTLNVEKSAHHICEGFAFSFTEADRPQVLKYLQKREGGFEFELLPVKLDDGDGIMSYIPIYRGKNLISNKTTEQLVQMAFDASGKSGRCLDYVAKIAKQLTALGIIDHAVSAFQQSLENQLKRVSHQA